jgi:hypothetical protein
MPEPGGNAGTRSNELRISVALLDNSVRFLLVLVEKRMDVLLTIRVLREWHEVNL